MLGLMAHGILWSALNGLRYLTLVYVCLWAELATVGEAVAGPGRALA